MGCCDGWDFSEHYDGKCPECGELTYDGEAVIGCHYSPVECDVCGATPCDGSCQGE